MLRRTHFILIIIACSLSIVACKKSAPPKDSDSPVETETLSGRVLITDQVLTQVCWDQNLNFQCDDDESIASFNGDEFTIDVIKIPNRSGNILATVQPASDASFNYFWATPISRHEVISPLSTLVSLKLMTEPGMDVSSVNELLAWESEIDPAYLNYLDDYQSQADRLNDVFGLASIIDACLLRSEYAIVSEGLNDSRSRQAFYISLGADLYREQPNLQAFLNSEEYNNFSLSDLRDFVLTDGSWDEFNFCNMENIDWSGLPSESFKELFSGFSQTSDHKALFSRGLADQNEDISMLNIIDSDGSYRDVTLSLNSSSQTVIETEEFAWDHVEYHEESSRILLVEGVLTSVTYNGYRMSYEWNNDNQLTSFMHFYQDESLVTSVSTPLVYQSVNFDLKDITIHQFINGYNYIFENSVHYQVDDSVSHNVFDENSKMYRLITTYGSHAEFEDDILILQLDHIGIDQNIAISFDSLDELLDDNPIIRLNRYFGTATQLNPVDETLSEGTAIVYIGTTNASDYRYDGNETVLMEIEWQRETRNGLDSIVFHKEQTSMHRYFVYALNHSTELGFVSERLEVEGMSSYFAPKLMYNREMIESFLKADN